MAYPDRFDNTADPAVKRGIIILAFVFICLIVFFFWYNNRSVSSPTDGSAEKPGLLSRIFSFSSTDQAQAEVADADADGLSDEAERQLGTDPAKADTDGDGLSDREEAKVYQTDPLKADTDNDGVVDGAEIASRRDPRNASPDAQWPPKPASLSN